MFLSTLNRLLEFQSVANPSTLELRGSTLKYEKGHCLEVKGRILPLATMSNFRIFAIRVVLLWEQILPIHLFCQAIKYD